MAITIERQIYNQTIENFMYGYKLLKEQEFLSTWTKGEIMDTSIKDIPESFAKGKITFPTVPVKTGDMGIYAIMYEPEDICVYTGRACPGDIKSRLSNFRSIMNKVDGKPTDSSHHQGASKAFQMDPDLANYRYSYITYANKKDCSPIELLILQELTKVAETEWSRKLKPIYCKESHIGL